MGDRDKVARFIADMVGTVAEREEIDFTAPYRGLDGIGARAIVAQMAKDIDEETRGVPAALYKLAVAESMCRVLDEIRGGLTAHQFAVLLGAAAWFINQSSKEVP